MVKANRAVVAIVVGWIAAGAALLTGAQAQDDPVAAVAPTTETATTFVDALVVDLSAAANDESLEEEDRKYALRTILRDELAVEPIGKFLFAGAPAELATDDQRAAYDELFPNYIAASFAEEIGELAEREIRVKGAILRGEDEAIVQSELFDSEGAKRAQIDWRLRWIDGEPRLLDVLVERVSPLVTKRQEFSAIAERDGVDALLLHMEDVVGDMEEQPEATSAAE